MAYVFEDAEADLGALGEYLRSKKDVPGYVVDGLVTLERWFQNEWRARMREQVQRGRRNG